ncbi:hypothetical protein C8J57DRAFT_1073769 [Mycena rebaudengoi]|nr:hypothetical protein C8J57DRAFT_1073769 [Mycena rebaudengoi]
MAEKIPDEIVSEILALHLKVPDDLFSQASSTSPFVSLSQSSSDVLLVCRAWLRCGTPFLYRTVILRSKAQTQALARSLRQHKDLGWFVKMLRVEDGFGSPMQHILKSAPNISDICLSLTIRSLDNISGLALGLPMINPARFILCDEIIDFVKNKVLTQLVATIMESVKKWSNLVCSEFPFQIFPG